ncbi:MAG: hypothetical protein HND48_09685 [Chloroflexi bacterium]|nr:hypothetical protein [Chloroflexota bacterium]
MPKVDLGLTFEGAVPLASWLSLADMNEIPLRSKQVAPIVKLLRVARPCHAGHTVWLARRVGVQHRRPRATGL